MSQNRKQDSIGFPPPLLGARPMRLPVLGESGEWLAIDKPAGIGLREHPWDPGVASLDAALNRQLQAGKPELLRRGASLFGSVYYLEPEVSGVALFAKSKAALADLRNRFGSEQLKFRFLFVSRADGATGARLSADAPLLPHRMKPKMIPSTAKGKKATTHFRLLSESASGWALWEATCSFLRPHQVRAHAAVEQIPVLGDVLYGGAAVPTLRDLQPKKSGPGLSSPVLDGFAMHLREVEFAGADGMACKVEAGLPPGMRVMLRRMHLSVPEFDCGMVP